jgi:GT2 family glycosyltransferase
MHLQVIDNASTNDGVTLIGHRFPNIEIKVLPCNLGYTGGNNVALGQAVAEGYDYVIICNQDIEVHERAVEWLVETAEAHRNAGVVGCIEADVRGVPRAIDCGRYCPWISRAFRRVEVEADNPEQPWIKVACVHGVLVLFNRLALESGILLDEKLFMYMDEVELGFQLAQKGFSAYTDRRVVVRHKSEPYQLSEYVGYLSQRNRLYLVQKHGRWYHKAFYHLYALLAELPLKVMVRSLQGKRRFAAACVRGHFDAMLGRMSRERAEHFIKRSE